MAMTASSRSEDDAQASGSNEPQIRRGRVDSLTLYEITDYELSLLEQGSPSSTFLNFSIFFFSTGLSFLVSLLTTTFADDKTFLVFSVVAGLGLSLGVVLFVLWYRTGQGVRGTCKKIRERIAD